MPSKTPTGRPGASCSRACSSERDLGRRSSATESRSPHARLEDIKQPLAAYLRALEPIKYDGPDALVRHMFVLLAPDKADDVHLKILSIMSRMLTDKEFIKDAEDCSDRAAFLDLVVEWENANLPTNVRNQSATG